MLSVIRLTQNVLSKDGPMSSSELLIAIDDNNDFSYWNLLHWLTLILFLFSDTDYSERFTRSREVYIEQELKN